ERLATERRRRHYHSKCRLTLWLCGSPITGRHPPARLPDQTSQITLRGPRPPRAHHLLWYSLIRPVLLKCRVPPTIPRLWPVKQTADFRRKGQWRASSAVLVRCGKKDVCFGGLPNAPAACWVNLKIVILS